MYTKEEIIAEIQKLYDEINGIQDNLIIARLTKDSERERRALLQMEGLATGIQQDLTVINNYIKEH